MSTNSNLFLSIGKPIKDEYGRTIGKVASFALTPNGKFDSAFIEFNDGQFSKQSLDHFKFNGAEVTYISKIKSEANVLCDQIPLIWRKDQAIRDLNEENYKSAFAMIQENLRRINAEKSDNEQAKSKLSSVLLGDGSQLDLKPKPPLLHTNQASALPEPPVVVYVKEVGK